MYGGFAGTGGEVALRRSAISEATCLVSLYKPREKSKCYLLQIYIFFFFFISMIYWKTMHKGIGIYLFLLKHLTANKNQFRKRLHQSSTLNLYLCHNEFHFPTPDLLNVSNITNSVGVKFWSNFCAFCCC